MTTVAVKDGVMACDSQVTGNFLSKTVKVIKGDDILVGYCGDWVAGMCFAQYIAGVVDEEPKGSKSDEVEFVILRPDGLYIADNHLREVKLKESFYAIGSGEQAAMVAMMMGATAKEAVNMAKKVDPYTGGRVWEFQLG